jgi:hypothetical protein
LGKFGLPEAQNVGGQAAKASHFPDAEVELFGDHHFGNPGGFGYGSIAKAHHASRSAAGCRGLQLSLHRVSSTTGPLEQPRFSRKWRSGVQPAGESAEKAPRKVLLSRGCKNFLAVRGIVSLTVSVSFSSLPFSLGELSSVNDCPLQGRNQGSNSKQLPNF